MAKKQVQTVASGLSRAKMFLQPPCLFCFGLATQMRESGTKKIFFRTRVIDAERKHSRE